MLITIHEALAIFVLIFSGISLPILSDHPILRHWAFPIAILLIPLLWWLILKYIPAIDTQHEKPLPVTREQSNPPKTKQLVNVVPLVSIGHVIPIQLNQFVVNTDGTVTDKKSGLMWTHCPMESKTTIVQGNEVVINSSCKLKSQLYTWDEAYQKGMNSSFSIYNDWQLPTVEQLKTLHNHNAGDEEQGLAYINRNVFPMPNCHEDPYSCIFWSSSKNAIDYADADNIFYANNSKHAVRLVRAMTQ